MPLSAGTAFQNGQYVIDAYCYNDDIGETYLATAIASGQQVLLKALHSDGQTVCQENCRQYQAQIERLANSAPAGIVPDLNSFIEYRRCYLVMAAQIGMPLTQVIQAAGPAKPAWATEVLRQAVATLAAIGSQNWRGLSLAPNQIWWQPQTDTIFLSGFRLFLDAEGDNTAGCDSQWGPPLAGLLYYLLTGELIDQTHAPLVSFHHQRPELNRDFTSVLQQGLSPQADFSLSAWIEQMPAGTSLAASPSQLPSVRPSMAMATEMSRPSRLDSRPIHQASLKPVRKKLTLGLLFTAVAAGVAGLGFSLTWRLQPMEVSGRSRLFDPEQDFPPLANWPNQTSSWPNPDGEINTEPSYGTPTNAVEQENRFVAPDVASPPEPQPKVQSSPETTPAVRSSSDIQESETAITNSEDPVVTPPTSAPKKSPESVIIPPQPLVETAPMPVAPAPEAPTPTRSPPILPEPNVEIDQPVKQRSMTSTVTTPTPDSVQVD